MVLCKLESKSFCKHNIKEQLFVVTSFCFSPGGLDTLVRDLTVEDRKFISQQLNVEDPEGKLDQFINSLLLSSYLLYAFVKTNYC